MATRDRHSMIGTLLQVGIGGAIGSMLRYAMGVAVMRAVGTTFPVAVLPVNIIGSFLMGVLFVVLTHRDMMHLGPLLMTGVLGGFTTFSAFSLETFVLYERGEIGLAAIYVLASVVFSVLGLGLGIWLARSLVA
ncbi:MAG: fluoride efflux transporter CrcB [Pseudomonadota bacterium]